MTPLFGGGVEAGMPDETTPIRASSIRGQLQFWWRATRGAGFASHQELFSRHGEIWGTTDKKSSVEIDVRNVTAFQLRACARYEWNPNARQGRGGWRLIWMPPFDNSPLPYALFPFQGKQPASPNASPEEAPARFVETALFTLRLRYPGALRQEIDAAAWAWVNFGGLGARTRRGCGALLCAELAPKDAVTENLGSWFRTHSADGESKVRDWPTMPNGIFIGSDAESPLAAWKKIIGMLQAFRQGPRIGRDPGTQPNRPGRSRYPEPEAIRRITGRRAPRHGRLAHVPDDAFPRAEFGLPIVFHFQGQDEPRDTVLYPSCDTNGEPRERMASPLILKPLALANGTAIPVILRLVTPPLAGVLLKQDNNPLDLDGALVVRASKLAIYKDSPLVHSPEGSAIEAFLIHARNNGFHEITR